MNNPYKVLGVPENADMDEIKKQYRALSRKYHPDANMNNPNKDQAEEKFKEVQAAYEQIVDEREHGRTGNYGDDYSYGGFGGYGFGRNQGGQTSDNSSNSYEQAAANYINYGRYKEALNALSNTPAEQRSARWYFLSAIANHRLGYTVVALEHARTASSMEPGNFDYENLVRSLENGGTWYSNASENYTRVDSAGCLKSCLYCVAINVLCGGGGRFCFCI